MSRYILKKEYLLIFFAKATSQVHACMDLATAREREIYICVNLSFVYFNNCQFLYFCCFQKRRTINHTHHCLIMANILILTLSYLIGLIPKAKEYLPTLLMDGNSLIYGTVEARSYVTAIYITVLLSVVCLAISFPVFNKKYL